jgi:hypothetical protein
MVMGGLIQDTKINSTNGLPLLNRIPVLGGLFGSQALTNNRNELVLFVTPRTVSDSEDIARTIEDLRRKMETLDRQFPATPNWPASPPSLSDRFDQSINPYRWELPRSSVPKPVAPPAGQPTQEPLPAPTPGLLPAPTAVPAPAPAPK